MSLATAFSTINWRAVLVAGVLHIVISLAWYQPVFFGRAWVKLSGKEMNPAVRWIPVGLASHLVCILALAMMFYRELFAAYSVERLLAEHHDCMIDFGAGIYESDEMFARVQKALSDFLNVVLVLPSADIDESRRILKERDLNPPADLRLDLNAHFLRHHTYYDLARITVYTRDRTPEETCQEILERVQS
jgi:hypothetical protein